MRSGSLAQAFATKGKVKLLGCKWVCFIWRKRRRALRGWPWFTASLMLEFQREMVERFGKWLRNGAKFDFTMMMHCVDEDRGSSLSLLPPPSPFKSKVSIMKVFHR